MSQDFISASVLNFSDSDFEQAPDVALSEYQDKLLDLDFEGAVIAAPLKALPVSEQRFPIVVGIGVEGVRDYHLPAPFNTYLVASSLENGEVSIRPVFRSDKAIEANKKPIFESESERPTDDELEGLSSKLAWIDGTKFLVPIEYHNGTWSFNLVYFDQMSNSVLVEIDDPALKKPKEIDTSIINSNHSSRGLSNSGVINSNENQTTFEIEKIGKGSHQKVVASGAIHVPKPTLVQVPEFIVNEHNSQTVIDKILPISFVFITQNAEPVWSKTALLPVRSLIEKTDTAIVNFNLEIIDSNLLQQVSKYPCAIYLNAGGKLFGPQLLK